MHGRFFLTLVGIGVLSAVILYLNAIALEHFFYWTYWWYDIVMHFLGGAFVGSATAWALVRFGVARGMTTTQRAYAALAAILVVGIGWEVFEYVNGFFIGETNIFFDTTLDLIMDVIGALVGARVIFSALVSGADVTSEATPHVE